LSDVAAVRHGGVLTEIFLWALGVLLGGLSLAIVTLLKGKIWTGIAGIFLPIPLLIIGATRLARPGSPWARWRYPAGSRKLATAVRREERWRRPVIRIKIRIQELIAGRHDMRPSETRRRSNRSL
jgi:hypothetical protein